jgi:hypothetical protein
MGIPLLLFGKERELGFGHLVPRPRNYSGQLTLVFFFFKYCTSAGTLSKRKDFTLSSMVNISSIVFEIVNHVLFSSMKATNSNLRARTGHGRSGPGVQAPAFSRPYFLCGRERDISEDAC